MDKQCFLDVDEEIPVKSISYNQEEILLSIYRLFCPNGFELDPTYSSGNFYKNIPEPKYKFDLIPQSKDVQQADVRKLPLSDESIESIVFDPPFIAGVEGNKGIIRGRFGCYKNIQTELWNMYYDALKELYRILKPNGVLVVKCQDTINSGKQYLSHIEIINVCIRLGMYPKDLFILLSRARLMGNWDNQYHSRKYHSYFIVFIKQKSPVYYRYINKKSFGDETPFDKRGSKDEKDRT